MFQRNKLSIAVMLAMGGVVSVGAQAQQSQRIKIRSSFSDITAFRRDGPEAKEERGETDDYEAPDHEHVPIPMIEFVQERGALACLLD